MKIFKTAVPVTLVAVMFLFALSPAMAATGAGEFKDDNKLIINFGIPVEEQWAKNPENYRVFEKNDPDIQVPVKSIELGPRNTQATLTFADTLNKASVYVIETKGVISAGKAMGDREFLVKQGSFQILFTILISAMLINNFVFTKYLGLCIFFGVSQKKETAIGMGITFTIVMVLSAVMCWALYVYVLAPYNLGFLKIIVFIGTTAIFVQAVDTILRKVNPYLFKKLGVFLVLIVTNCIVLAVPLINADSGYGPSESGMLGLGAGVGFGIALFLMACVREKLEVCDVPPTFRGLPIAFVVTGLFALAFLGFSGLSLF
jgi:electron transport complex protein RnfA